MLRNAYQDLNTEVGKQITPISPPHKKSISQLQQTCYLTHFLDLISLVVFLFSDYTYNNKLNFNYVFHVLMETYGEIL